MTSISTRDGKVVLKSGKVGTETSCCCGQGGGEEENPCICATLSFDVVVRVTFSRPFGICGLIEFNNPVEFWISGNFDCVNGVFTSYTDIDVSLCNPESSCAGVRIFWNIVNPCNCQNTNYCDVEITGWEEVDCAGGITSIELV